MAKVAPDGDGKGKSLFADSPSGRKIEYRLAGRCGAGDPVLLVLPGMMMPGFGRCTEALQLTRAKGKGEPKDKTQQLIDQLPFKIVGVARPGYDGSTMNKAPKDMTYEDQCTDMIAVMDHVGAEKFCITASSSGGTIALTVAYTKPDRVTAVQLDCCDANYGPGYPKGKKMNEAIPDGQDITYVDGNARPGGAMWCCCCRNPLCCCCACCCYKGFWMDSYIETGPVPYKLEEIRCPVQIISGTKDDQVDPNTSKFHASRLPNSKLDCIDGMGHCQIPADQWEQKMMVLHSYATKAAPTQAEMS